MPTHVGIMPVQPEHVSGLLRRHCCQLHPLPIQRLGNKIRNKKYTLKSNLQAFKVVCPSSIGILTKH